MNDATPQEQLLRCLQLILSGDWSFIQLRGATPGPEAIDGDDIDLLGSEASVAALIAASQEWVRCEQCHVRIVRQRPDKTEFFLFSVDGLHYLHFDLWVHLRQVDHGRSALSYNEVAQFATRADGEFFRFSVDVEACVFLQHLLSKKKTVSDDKQQLRLEDYADRCAAAGHIDLTDRLRLVREADCVSAADDEFSMAILRERLQLSTTLSSKPFFDRLRMAGLSAPRRTRWVSIMGCDGAGKTSLAEKICEDGSLMNRVYTGKHLYRKSLLYKLAVIFVRPLTFQSRETFDELIAPLVYLRACFGLRLKLMFGRSGRTFVDRALPDFLCLDRKTDQPRFSRCVWLMDWFGKRIPVVHCLASYENVQQRKDEVTEAGHRQYDDAMFALHTSRCPTDYVAFNNDASLEAAAERLPRILQVAWFQSGQKNSETS